MNLNLFSLGRAAIYPAGSWDISQFNAQAQFKMGAFPPPVKKAGDTCYISDHVDIALGMNAKSKNAEAAKTFLTWTATPEFATRKRTEKFPTSTASIAGTILPHGPT